MDDMKRSWTRKSWTLGLGGGGLRGLGQKQRVFLFNSIFCFLVLPFPVFLIRFLFFYVFFRFYFFFHFFPSHQSHWPSPGPWAGWMPGVGEGKRVIGGMAKRRATRAQAGDLSQNCNLNHDDGFNLRLRLVAKFSRDFTFGRDFFNESWLQDKVPYRWMLARLNQWIHRCKQCKQCQKIRLWKLHFSTGWK